MMLFCRSLMLCTPASSLCTPRAKPQSFRRTKSSPSGELPQSEAFIFLSFECNVSSDIILYFLFFFYFNVSSINNWFCTLMSLPCVHIFEIKLQRSIIIHCKLSVDRNVNHTFMCRLSRYVILKVVQQENKHLN